MAGNITPLPRTEGTPFVDGAKYSVEIADDLRRIGEERAAREAIKSAMTSEQSPEELAIERIRDITAYMDDIQSDYLEREAA